MILRELMSLINRFLKHSTESFKMIARRVNSFNILFPDLTVQVVLIIIFL